MQTRAQRDLILAQRLVSDVSREKQQITRDTYGGLCHNFPVLVRTCGLCQALAFSADKKAAGGERGRAHELLLDHVSQMLGSSGDPLVLVREASAMEYMQQTRRVLAAWIYFKRFAVSILKVASAQAAKAD